MSLEQKLERLKTILRDMESIVIGYSGGVDSTFLAKIATDVLGDQALSVSAISESYPLYEQEEARQFAGELGLHWLTIRTSEIDNPEYRKNNSNRCFFCKEELVTHLERIRKERGFKTIAIGAITDDLGDWRPGQAAARQGGARFPLIEADLGKEEIRRLSQEMNLPIWNKPSFACLASRFPYGEEITREKLELVERAESVLREAGFRQFRVRHHNNLARIEVLPEEMGRLLELREELARRMKEIGYPYVTMDLVGYRSGSMNEILVQIEAPAKR